MDCKFIDRRAIVIILGLSGGHDANWCVWRDGAIVGAFEKERFSRRRHDGGDVTSYLIDTLCYLGLGMQDIDLVATSEPVALAQGPGHTLIGGRRYEHLTDWQWQSVRLLNRVLPCVSIPHHLCHAAYARYTCRAVDAAVVTLDGGGDQYTVNAGASSTVSSWTGARLDWIERIDYTDFGSLWAGYARAVFGSEHAEGKLMGLAAFGSHRLVTQMRDLVLVRAEGLFEGTTVVKNCWPDYRRPPLLPVSTSWEDPRAQDAARAVQEVTNEAALSIAKTARRLTGKSSLALAGGVALNGYMVELLATQAGFEQTFVSPAVNDGGIAVGAALFAAHHELGQALHVEGAPMSPFLGMDYAHWTTTETFGGLSASFGQMEREDAISEAADRLARGQIVAWYEGRSEHGSRALGNRSILSSPTSDAYRNKLNQEVKFRESFRPVAPAVLRERATDYFETSDDSPYMMRIVRCRESVEMEVPAVIHIDGTARIQTLDDSSGGLRQIVEEFDRITGIPLVVNTSLNVRTPIVETPRQAAEVFDSSPIDFIYINGYFSRK